MIAGKLWLAPSWPFHGISPATWFAFLPLVAAVFGYPRVLFSQFDRFLDP